MKRRLPTISMIGLVAVSVEYMMSPSSTGLIRPTSNLWGFTDVQLHASVAVVLTAPRPKIGETVENTTADPTGPRTTVREFASRNSSDASLSR